VEVDMPRLRATGWLITAGKYADEAQAMVCAVPNAKIRHPDAPPAAPPSVIVFTHALDGPLCNSRRLPRSTGKIGQN
jgi:hypothetical protein